MNFSKIKGWMTTKKGIIITAVLLCICILAVVLVTVFFSKGSKDIVLENEQETAKTYGIMAAEGTSEQKKQSQKSEQLKM